MLLLALGAPEALAQDPRAGIPAGSPLGIELAATVDRVRAEKPIVGRHLAFLRVVDRTGEDAFTVEFMDVRLSGYGAYPGDATFVPAGGMFLGPSPPFLPVEPDSGTVTFVKTGLRGTVVGPPELWLDRVFALWIREVGAAQYQAEVVPWGGSALEITGVHPTALNRATQVPSLAAVTWDVSIEFIQPQGGGRRR